MSNEKQNNMGDMEFDGTSEEWEALVEKNKMSNTNVKTVTMNEVILDNVFEDLEFLSRLMDDMISDMHNVKGGQQARHSYMLYREYVWKIRAALKKII
jgi:hypothetical protein